LVIAIIAMASASHAQTPQHGISSAGTDFYVGIMPPIKLNSDYMPQGAYILIGSMQDANAVSINYFDNTGKEFNTGTKVLARGRTWKFQMSQLSVYPSTPGEVAQYKAAHITSKYPVSVQVYQEGSASGEMYTAIPTSALGQNYVVASWYDNPISNNPSVVAYQADSRSEFEIIGAYDSTTVIFTPNTTTLGGIIGANSGDGATGTPHPKQILLNRGQVYWVRSVGDRNSNDMTGTSVTSNKPVAVLGGQERALLGDASDPNVNNAFLVKYSDARNMLVEEMIPEESWDSEYVSIPFMPPQSQGVDQSDGYGDMYRVVADSQNVGTMELLAGNSYKRGTEYDNITNPCDFMTQTRDQNGSRVRQSVVMYDYFMGDGIADITTSILPDEMNLIGMSHWPTSAVFQVPQNAGYHGAQFINVITWKDSLPNINVQFNGTPGATLATLSKAETYTIPLHPELTGITCKLTAGDYMIWGNTPFACYSYGRTEPQMKSSAWGYAAPVGMLYSFGSPTKAQVQSSQSCNSWAVTIDEGGNGIASLMLLNDPLAIYAHPPYVSYNTILYPQPKFTPGDTTVSFTVQVQSPTQDAYAAILVTGRAGNDTVFEFHYTASVYTMSNTSASMLKTNVGKDSCTTFTLHIVKTGTNNTISIGSLKFGKGNQNFSFSTIPVLPDSALRSGDSVVVMICFNSIDTLSHTDSLIIPIGCLDTNFVVRALGVAPIIVATDHNFGDVTVGDTICDAKAVNVKNIGTGDLVIDTNTIKSFVGDNNEFRYGGTPALPYTLHPGQNIWLDFCFTPTKTGSDTGIEQWSTNQVTPFLRQVKDTSILIGSGIEPGLNWDRRTQTFTAGCNGYDTARVYLKNPSDPETGSDITVNNVHIIGPDSADFTIIGDQLGYPLTGGVPWTLGKGDSIWVDIMFHPVCPGSGHMPRTALLTVLGSDDANNPYTDTMMLIGNASLGVAEVSTPSFGIDMLQPNPAGSRIVVRFHAKGPLVELEIFDVLGRQVWNERVGASGEETSEQRLDLRGLAKGSYILRMSSDEGVASGRFEIE
jgi:hypothetical protein